MPHLTTSDGVLMHYRVDGDGPHDVLLLHGMGSSAIWGPMLDHIDRRLLRVVAIDFRGHGDSGGDGQGFSYPRLHEDILAVADAVQSRTCVVVGFSGGCRNAAWLAAKSPDRVRGIMMIGSPGMGIVPVPPQVVVQFIDTVERTADFPREFEPWFTEKIGHRRSHVVASVAALPRAVIASALRLWMETSIAEEVRGISQPTLVIAGAREPIYHPQFQRETTLATLPRARMEVLDCSHFIPCEEPAVLADRLTRFVATLT